jgi:hypothetical protein
VIKKEKKVLASIPATEISKLSRPKGQAGLTVIPMLQLSKGWYFNIVKR